MQPCAWSKIIRGYECIQLDIMEVLEVTSVGFMQQLTHFINKLWPLQIFEFSILSPAHSPLAFPHIYLMKNEIFAFEQICVNCYKFQ